MKRYVRKKVTVPSVQESTFLPPVATKNTKVNKSVDLRKRYKVKDIPLRRGSEEGGEP